MFLCALVDPSEAANQAQSIRTLAFNFVRSIGKLRPLEPLLASLTEGRAPDSWIARLAPNSYQYAVPSLRRVTRQGIQFQLDLSDVVDCFIFYAFREAGRERLWPLVPRGGTVLDVGANVGQTLLTFAKLVGERGVVHGFEPDPVNFERLLVNLSLNPGLKNVRAHKLALGDAITESEISVINRSNRGMNRILPKGDAHHDSATRFKIQVETIDTFVAQQSLRKIDVLKIDVEGYESHVLRGAQQTIRRDRPIVFIELNDDMLRSVGSSTANVVTLLAEFGYELRNAASGKPVASTDNFQDSHFDLLATP